MNKKARDRHSLAETLDSFDVNGAAHEASPNLIFGTSSSPSISANLSVMDARSNCRTIETISSLLHDRGTICLPSPLDSFSSQPANPQQLSSAPQQHQGTSAQWQEEQEEGENEMEMDEEEENVIAEER